MNKSAFSCADFDGGVVAPELQTTIEGLLGGGTPLDRDLALQFGAPIAQDLTKIRIHQGALAQQICRSVGAEAFACRSDIFFDDEMYAPHTCEGRRRLAHEIAHVVQQSAGLVLCAPGMTVRPAAEAWERQADAFALAMDSAVPHLLAVHEEMESLRAAQPRGFADQPRVVQRTAAQLARNAKHRPPRADTANQYCPSNCHEAVFGWLLDAMGYTHPWQLLRVAGNGLLHPRTYGGWLKEYIYSACTNMSLADLADNAAHRPGVGDILFTNQGNGMAMHSMVVVDTNPVRIRGFNNAGTFNYPAMVAAAATPGDYDNNDRDVTDGNLWTVANTKFGANNANSDLWRVRYQDAEQRVRECLAHYDYSLLRTPGWRHSGQRPCLPSCPG